MPETATFPIDSSETFPPPTSLVAEISSGLRLAYSSDTCRRSRSDTTASRDDLRRGQPGLFTFRPIDGAPRNNPL